MVKTKTKKVSKGKTITLTIKDFNKEDRARFSSKLGGLNKKWTDGSYSNYPTEYEQIYRGLTMNQIKRISDRAQETLPNHRIRIWK